MAPESWHLSEALSTELSEDRSSGSADDEYADEPLGAAQSSEYDGAQSADEYDYDDDFEAEVPASKGAFFGRARLERALNLAEKYERAFEEADAVPLAAEAALAVRSRAQLRRVCFDGRLLELLVSELAGLHAPFRGAFAFFAPNDLPLARAADAADALAHLVSLDSSTAKAQFFDLGAHEGRDAKKRRGDTVARRLVAARVAPALAMLLSLEPPSGRVLDDAGDSASEAPERIRLRRAALRLALRLASQPGGAGDDAVDALRAEPRIRGYLARRVAEGYEPHRAAKQVATAKRACTRAAAQYEERARLKARLKAKAKADDAAAGVDGSSKAADEEPEPPPPPPPTPTAQYWRTLRKRGLLSPAFARTAAIKEVRDAAKLQAALGLRAWQPWLAARAAAEQSPADVVRAAGGPNNARPKRGVRILCLDGGGTRGVITIQVLKELQSRCFGGREPHQVFDLIVGTSTGAILAVLLGAKQCSLVDAERLYDQLITSIFVKEGLASSTTSLVLKRAKYEERHIEAVLANLLGDDDLLDTQPTAPHVACLAACLSVDPAQLCVLRSYEYPPPARTLRQRMDGLFETTQGKVVPPARRASRYAGSCRVSLRDALRAATAAPMYFTPLALRDQLVCDGALIANNPSAVAYHEALALFPGRQVDVLVSVGTGEAAPEPTPRLALTWEDIVNQLVDSATSTTLVHDILQDLLPAQKYHRFNPIIPPCPIDSTDAPALEIFRCAAKDFFAEEANEAKAEVLADVLNFKAP